MDSAENKKKSKKISILAVIAFFLSLILCSFLIRVTILNKIQVEEMQLEQLLFEKALQINEVISKQVYKTQTLSLMIIHRNGEVENFDKMARSIILNDSSILAVLLAPGGIVSDVYPPDGNNTLLRMNLFDLGAGTGNILSNVDSDTFILEGPITMPQGDYVLIGKTPVFTESQGDTDKLWGFVFIVFKLPQVLDDAELDIMEDLGYSYELFKINEETGRKQIITANVQHIKTDNNFIEKQIRIHNTDWYLQVFPIHVWYSNAENIILIFTGFFLCFIIFFIVQNNFDLKRMRGVYETMAKIDVLTGIYNRRYIEENLKGVINTISRSGGVISLIMIDVDFFKKYNDTYGHGKGDSCLKAIASSLAQTLFREEDFVARYGGEEFVVVLPLCDERGAHKVAERLLQNVRDCAILHENNEVANYVTISVGVTTGNAEHTRSGNDYLKKADEALYISKQTGRNKYTFLPFP